MRKKIALFISCTIFLILVLIMLKEVFAMPPPASHIWLMLRRQAVSSRKVRVEVTWQELGQPKKVELKALLKDIK